MCRWLSYTKLKLPELGILKIRNDLSVRKLLDLVNGEIRRRNSSENYEIERVDPDRDYLLPSGKIEVLLPRNQPLKDFIFIQENNFLPVELELVRELSLVLPWDSKTVHQPINTISEV